MIIAISVLNFSVKFLVTKHTQIIYFSYNVFKQPKSFLKKVSSKPKVLQMFLQIRSRRERDLLRLRKSIGIALCFLKKKQSKRYIAYSDVVRITGLEPAWVAPHEPESCASANSAISARLNYYIKCTFKIQ